MHQQLDALHGAQRSRVSMVQIRSNSLSSRNNPWASLMVRRGNAKLTILATNPMERLLQQLMHKVDRMQEMPNYRVARSIHLQKEIAQLQNALINQG